MKVIVGKVIALFCSPLRFFWIALAISLSLLLLDGTFIRLWSLHRDHNRLVGSVAHLEKQIKGLDANIRRARDPHFIEEQARERFQMVQDEDLVFLFSDTSEASR